MCSADRPRPNFLYIPARERVSESFTTQEPRKTNGLEDVAILGHKWRLQIGSPVRWKHLPQKGKEPSLSSDLHQQAVWCFALVCAVLSDKASAKASR
jgi:hypothetical protein